MAIRFKHLTKDVCFKLAKKCKTCTEFWAKYKTAADKASREGWIHDYTWLVLKHERRLTRERCFELAKDCRTRKELKLKHPGALAKAKREGWITDYDWLVSGRIKRTYSVCETEAKKYTSVADFRKYSPSLHDASYKNGWLADFFWLRRTEIINNRNVDNVYAYEFVKEKAVYVGRTVNIQERNQAHHRDKSTVFKYAHDNHLEIPPMKLLEKNVTLEEGLAKEDWWVKKYKRRGWTVLNICKTGISSGSLGALGKIKLTQKIVDNAAHKYTTLRDFREYSPHEYGKALKKGWIKNYTWLKRERLPHNTWTREGCYNEAKRYVLLADFREGSPVAYTTANSNNWLSDYDWLIRRKASNGTWSKATFEEISAEISKYSSRKEFLHASHAAYRRAQSQGWLDELLPSQLRDWSTFDACEKEARKYMTRTTFARGCNAAYYSSIRNGWLDIFFPKSK